MMSERLRIGRSTVENWINYGACPLRFAHQKVLRENGIYPPAPMDEKLKTAPMWARDLYEICLENGIDTYFVCRLLGTHRQTFIRYSSPDSKNFCQDVPPFHERLLDIFGIDARQDIVTTEVDQWHWGKELRRHRKQAGLTLAELSNRVGISRHKLSRMERSPSLDTNWPYVSILETELGVDLFPNWARWPAGQKMRWIRVVGLGEWINETAKNANIANTTIIKIERSRKLTFRRRDARNAAVRLAKYYGLRDVFAVNHDLDIRHYWL